MYLYIPERKFWYEKRKNVIIYENMNLRIDNRREHNSPKVYPTTDVNLAIYYCRGRNPNDTIIFTYILEYYYLFYAEYVTNLLKTVSDAYTLCKILKYETYISILKNMLMIKSSKHPNDSQTLLEL
ncbi:7415_t:CDS:2 [Funneliformis mosseae]|uniref:7415_t:CDS:1 n=1 Tax=Funneliformis mosseae TaxID=27381 RepID=A0A9N9CX56_FUNMO|nr:7415_t:CDS:2 [Funneliformis mosseae]